MSTDAPPTRCGRSPRISRPAGADQARRRPEKIAAQHAAEKLTARERIALLIDDGHVRRARDPRPAALLPARDGRPGGARGRRRSPATARSTAGSAAVAAYDFTVMAGSMGMTGELKVTRLRELALTKRIPLIWLLDSAGARIQEAVGSLFAGTGHLFREEVINSRRDPADRGADGAVRGGHRLHPRAGRLRADGQGAGRWRWPARTWCAPRSARTSPRRSSAARACTAASRASATSR